MHVFFYNYRGLIQVQSGYIPYVLVYNEHELFKYGVSLTRVNTDMELFLVMGSKYGKPKWYVDSKGLSRF